MNHPASRDPNAHLSLALLFGLGVVCVLDSMIVSALITPLKAHFGASDEEIGRLSSAATLAALLAAPVMGLLANRFGRKAVLIGGAVLWSAASLASGLVSGFVALLLCRMLTGIGDAAYSGVAPSWLADLYRPRWRNLLFSLYMLRNKLGSAAALGLGGWLAAEHGWRSAFLVAGVPGLLLALLLLSQREPRLGASEQVTTPPPLRKGLEVFRYPGYCLHLLALLFFYTAMSTQMWIPAFLYRSFALDNQQASAFLAQVLIFTLPVGLIGGYLSSLWLRRHAWGFPAFIASTSLIAAGLFLQAYSTPSLTVCKLAIAAGTATFGFSAGTLTTLVVESVPAHLRTSAVSFSVMLGIGVAGMLGPELIGRLSDAFGLHNALRVAPACYLLAALTWLAMTLYLLRTAPLSNSTDEVPA
ncbi:MFS transporter [Pseudomonas sp. Marseille-P9899]|uniref:MFS transporter n=1 Tax=Pseudomonas sp. Marseille-P9899 TaxID=2730401 RepID=UPI00158BA49F|nr:MFS transporter [Pseudomonas sp. Marseille-P9899]